MKKLLSLVIGLITTQILIGQEIDVTGKNISIPSGSATYTSKRNTFFGYQVSSQGSITKTFTIKNYGYSNLTIGVVTATGDFTVTAQPVSPVAPGGFTTFTVTYDPSTIATHTGTITVPNNDANEGTYTFGVQGVGLNVATQRQVRWVHNGVLSRPTTVVLQGVTYNVVPTTYTTVQTAINAAAQYDIVYITDGRYFNPREAVSTNCSFIGLGQDLALYDSIQNKNNIIITSQTGDHTTSNARLVGYGFNLKGGNDITIQGLELDSVRVNAFWNSNCCTYNPATDVKILNNSINGTHGHGIKTDYWASGQGSVIDRGAWEISGNTFANIGYYNGYFNNCTPASVSAMWLGEAGGCFLIDGNTITNVRWAAVLCNGYGDAFTSANGAVTISNNTINSTIDAGIQLGWNYGGNGYSAGYRNSYVTGNYIQNANTSHAAGIGAIVIHISFVGNTNILMNHITSSYNGVAINIAGWNNSMAADTARIQYNNFCGLVAGSSAITHIGGQNGNGFWGTPDNLGKYKCDNNYYGSASGPTYYLNPGGIGWELKEETTLIGPGNPYSQGDFAFLPFRTIPYPNPLVPACQCEPNSSNTIVTACGSYLWNSVTYTTSGTYSHSMPNAGVGGCDSVAYLVLTISNPSITALSQTNVSCFGGTNGSAAVNAATGGIAPYSYNWTPGNPTGDGTTSVTGLSAGTWTCTVTDAASCTGTGTFNITSPSAITVTPSSQTNVSCFGGTNGAASINTPTGGAGGYTYNWTPGNPTGDGTTSVTGLTAGTWTCTVTDANLCVATVTFNIVQPGVLTLSPSSQSSPLCFGYSTGSAQVQPATGGTPGYTYNWSPAPGGGQGTTTAFLLSAQTYTCTVTDANGCQSSLPFTLTQPPALVSSTASQTNVSCFGGSNGTASIVAPSGGTPGYTMDWEPGSPSGEGTISASGLTAGTWTCTVTDNYGCITTVSFNVTSPSALSTVAASQTNVSCNGGSNGAASINTPTGGAGGYTYNWTPGNPTGDGTVSVTGLAAGTWTCTVTDANSCTATQTFNITAPSAIVVTAASQTNVSCFGGTNGAASINTPTGGAGGYTYNWTPGNPTGDGTVSVTGLSAGTWTCTVTDANSCTTTQTFNITAPSAIVVTAASQTNTSCFGGSNGAASINTPTGGAGGYTYNWTPGNPTGDGTVSVTALAAGTWTCTVTDANSCTATQTFNITSPSVINVTAASATYVSCFGGSNGAASINTPTGGAGGFTYNWTPGNPTGDGTTSVTGLTAGTWTCTVTDANSCTATQTFNITQPTQVVASAAAQTNVLCNGAATGAATVAASGGIASYSYSWAPSGGTAATATGLTAGTYTATVTDGNGCTATQTFNITQPSALSATTMQTNVSCNAGSNGDAMVMVSGGTGTYTYSWAPSGGSNATATGLSAGTYTCTTTDANGCTITNTFNITAPSALVAGASSQTNVSCNGGSNGAATVGAAGGAGSYTYSWSPSGGTAATATGLAAGVYTVTVTDANSCTATQTFNITQPSALSATTMQTNVSCNAGSNGDAMVMVSGGTGSYTYSWAPSGGTNATATGLTAGTYTCTTTDANGCTLTSTVSITEPSALTAASSASTVLCNGDTSTVTVTASGGVSPYTGAGSFNQVAGSYTFTVTDNNGCTTTTSVTITEPTAISTVVASTNVLCNGDSTGSIDLTVTGGTAPYTFNWNSGQYTTEDLTNIPAGSYSGVLTDANGCTDGGTVVINEPSVLAATAVITNPTGCTTNDGSIDLSVAGGTPGYAYVWSTTATTQDVTALDGGNYTVTVTDTNGCSAVESFTLTEPGAPTVTFAAGLDTVCQSTTTPFTLTGASPAGGVFSGTGMINDTVFDPMTASLGFNVITYTYTDSLGCTGSAVDSILVDICTDLASQVSGLNSQVSIFPNPNNGTFTVITSAFADVMIYDAQGKLVAAQKVQANVQNQINIESSGIYLITIVAADGSRTTQRVVVTK